MTNTRLSPSLRDVALFVLFVSAVFTSFPLAASGERILSYHSEIQIFADGSVEVAEHIGVRSEQRNIRRGIYRDFPIRYRDRFGNVVRVRLEVIGVLRDGQPEPWFTEQVANGVRVNTGDDRFLPGAGDYTFTIRYRTHRQLGYFDQHDELYWNVTGLGWDFPIDKASAEVRLPQDVASGDIRLDAYTGPAGSTASDALAISDQPGVARFEATRPLGRGEGLTIAVGFPKGIVAEPSWIKRAGWLLYDNRGLLMMLLTLVGILFFYIKSWQSKGRGPEPGVIIARYEPPDGYSPAGLRYVWRESYDERCFAADLVELGVKGALQIERKKSFLTECWSLEKTGQIDAQVPPSQSALFPALFKDGPLLELKSSNASTLQSAMAAHKKALETRYLGQYIEPNNATRVIGWVASGVLTVLAYLLAGDANSFAMAAVVFVLFAINLLFSRLMPAPTRAGRDLLDHIEGLRLYLSVAEREDLARLQHRNEADGPSITPERFEALLPYALALGVEEAWAGKFTSAVGAAAAEQARQNMAWYTGSGAALGSLGAMSQSLGNSLSSTISSSASPPGSSSGGGGGGFSGGGGGGGGGGGR